MPAPTLPGADEFFDSDWYRAMYPDTHGVDPWEHFMSHGEKERRSPGPGFDAEFYASTYLALEAGNALRHFLLEGRTVGHLPVKRTRTATESQSTMADALAGLAFPFLLVGNDAQRAGAPLLLLEISRHLVRRGWSPVFVLQRGGPLLSQFQSVGPTFLVAEGHDLSGLGAALQPETPVLANTGWGAPILAALRVAGPHLLLVHEMPDYLDKHDLLSSVPTGTTVVAAFPTVVDGLIQRLPPTSTVRTAVPGLLHSTSSPGATERVARLVTERFGANRLLFIGAGFADHRKGFDRFLDAARDIHEREPRSAFIWLGELGDWARQLELQAQKDGIPLLVPGFRRDAAAWYANSDVYLLTSRQDPGPTTVMDAARCGVPFVAAPGDLGLTSLANLLDGVGWFLHDEADVPPRALDVARSLTAENRAERSDHIESLASFGRYVESLLRLLRMEGLVDEPPLNSMAVDVTGAEAIHTLMKCDFEAKTPQDG